MACLMGVKQNKDGNLVAVIHSEHYVELKKDLQLKSKSFSNLKLLKQG